jgi:hypothetical protein
VKRRRVGGDEQDAFSRYWRHRYAYLARAGVVARIKRRANKRERREAKKELGR